MSEDPGKPLRLFVDPFTAWRELAFKTAEMIAASAQAGAASARAFRVAVIEEPRAVPPVVAEPEPEPESTAPARKHAPAKATSRKKRKKHAKRR
jgi:hypothetical protein